MPILRLGSRGPYVQLLQLALTRAGFNPGSIDGIFGQKTNAAVIMFQKQNGLKPDGIVGLLTWAELEMYLTGYVRHIVSRGDTFWLLAEKYHTTVNAIQIANPTVNPLNIKVGSTLIIPLGFDVVPTDIAYSYALLVYIARGLAMRYPFLRLCSIGNSCMGKELLCLSIGKGNKKLLFNAAHHANEWITTPVVLKYLEELSFSYANNSSICGVNAKSLLEGKTLYIVPMVNPDGVDLVTGALSTDSRFYSKAEEIASDYPQIPFPSGWKANITGTDLNLNYPADWEKAKEIKFAHGYVSPAPRDFVGCMPLSEPESHALYDFSVRQCFDLTLSYHTQGEVIYWKYRDFNPEGSLKIGEALSRASGYSLELTPEESSYAGYKDWFIQTFNRPGYTIEAGKGVNPLPIMQFDAIYKSNCPLMTTALNLV